MSSVSRFAQTLRAGLTQIAIAGRFHGKSRSWLVSRGAATVLVGATTCSFFPVGVVFTQNVSPSESHAVDIVSLEAPPSEDWKCATCSSSTPYLDAAENVLKCAMCDTPAAQTTKGSPPIICKGEIGTNDLGQGCVVEFFPSVLDSPEYVFCQLLGEVNWEQHLDRLNNDQITTQPRLIAYQTASPRDPRMIYSYPGLIRPLVPAEFTPTVKSILTAIKCSKSLGTEASAESSEFNSAHLNLYRTGGDHVSWHTDQDVDFYGGTPVIASVSFGASRDFVLRRVDDHNSWVKFTLTPGSLLVMKGLTQEFWEHCVPKSQEVEPRINITFRQVVKSLPPQAPMPVAATVQEIEAPTYQEKQTNAHHRSNLNKPPQNVNGRWVA